MKRKHLLPMGTHKRTFLLSGFLAGIRLPDFAGLPLLHQSEMSGYLSWSSLRHDSQGRQIRKGNARNFNANALTPVAVARPSSSDSPNPHLGHTT